MALTLTPAERQLVHDGLQGALRSVLEGVPGAMRQVVTLFDLVLGDDRNELLKVARSLKEEEEAKAKKNAPRS